MTSFREYLDHRERARMEQVRALARSRSAKLSTEDFVKLHAAHEWASLPEQVWAVVEHEQIDGQRFFRAEHAVGVGGVVVSFGAEAASTSGSPCLFSLVFRSAAGAAPVGSSLAPEQWRLRAARSEGEIVWTLAHTSCRHAETTASMATQIATQLVEYYDRYEKACGRDPLAAALPELVAQRN